MKSVDIRTVLKRQNPFISSSVGDPLDSQAPDVMEIHQTQYEQITDLIRQKKSNPKENFACLVTGEAGSGKTHLIARLFQFCGSDIDFSYAYVQPLENSQFPFSYLVKEIITNLTRNIFKNSKFNQLDRLLGILFNKLLSESSKGQKRVNEYIANLNTDPLAVYEPEIYKYFKNQPTKKLGIRTLEKFDNSFDADFLEVLFAYRIKEKKNSAIKWLKNQYLDDMDLKNLGKRFSNETSNEKLELKSRQILQSLGLLFQYTNHTMILCFDRLENLETHELITALGKGLEYFVDVTHAILPLVFYRGETWERQIKDVFNQQIVTRLENNKFDLAACNGAQAMKIILARLNAILEAPDNRSFAPFDESLLRKRFEGRFSLPREIINESNTMLKLILYGDQPIEVKNPLEVVQGYYQSAIFSLDKRYMDDNPEAHRLAKAIKTYFCGFPKSGSLRFEPLKHTKSNLGPLTKGKDPNKEVLGKIVLNENENFRLLIIVDDEERANTISAIIKRGIKYLEHFPESKVLFIRDERSTFKSETNWPKTHEHLEKFNSLGGVFLNLDRTDAVGWYALTELDYQLGNKEMTYFDSEGRTVEISSSDVLEFVESKLHSSDYNYFKQLDDLLCKTREELATKPKKSSEKTFPINEIQNHESEFEKSRRTKSKTKDSSKNNHAQQLKKVLSTQGLTVEVLEVVQGFRFTRFKVKPTLKKGTTVKKIKNQSENLQVELGLSTPPLIQAQAGFISIDIPRKDSKSLFLKDIVKTRKAIPNDPALTFPIGVSIDNEPYWADFSDPNMSSILVGGTSGSGKSVFLKSIALGLGMRYRPSALKIVLIDPKRVSFTDLADMPHLSSPIIMDNQLALKTLSQLVNQMEKRYEKFSSSKVIDIVDYNKKHRNLPRYVVLIDEYADLMMEKKANERLVQAIQKIGQKGRAAGIHLVLSTQRPDSKVITPQIKANLQLKIALKVTSTANSMIILDQPGAECLLGKGDLLVGGAVNIQRLQGPMVRKVNLK